MLAASGAYCLLVCHSTDTSQLHCQARPCTPRPCPQGHAVKRGMLAARGEYCLLMDADGATRFADLERLEGELDKILAPSG